MLIFNGELTHPSEIGLAELERGFFYGDGCFETLRLCKGTFPLWPWHQERLRETAEFLHLNLPDIFLSQEDMERLARLLAPAESGDYVFRLALWRTGGRGRRSASVRAHWMLQCLGLAPPFFQEARLAEKPITIIRSQGPHKTLGQNTYTTLALYSESDDMFLTDDRLRIVETLNSNVWIQVDERLLTPPLSSGCINGVWRRAVFSLRNSLNISCEEAELTVGDLSPHTPVMLGNALRGFYPVEGRPFPYDAALRIHQILWKSAMS